MLAMTGLTSVCHDWANVSVPELVKWTGIPIYRGALDGRGGTINARWDRSHAQFDPDISGSMPKSRYRDIKHNFKVNNNYGRLTRSMKKGFVDGSDEDGDDDN